MVRKTIFLLFLFSVLLLNRSSSFAWKNETTHIQITRESVHYLATNKISPRCIYQLRSELSTGVLEEDIPIEQAWFHFLPEVYYKNFVRSDCDSIEWGFGDLPCTGFGPTWASPIPREWTMMTNIFGWTAALDHAGTDRGWIALGHVLHLLQDLAVPAHVRNDVHPGLLYDTIDEDPLEVYAAKYKGVWASPQGDLKKFEDDPEEYLRQLAGYTRENFFSADTCFDPDLPGPEAEDEKLLYFYDKDEDPIAYKGARYWYCRLRPETIECPYTDPRRYSTINSKIAENQFEELGPLAVLYSSSLINHYQSEIGLQCEIRGNVARYTYKGYLSNNPDSPFIITDSMHLQIWEPKCEDISSVWVSTPYGDTYDLSCNPIEDVFEISVRVSGDPPIGHYHFEIELGNGKIFGYDDSYKPGRIDPPEVTNIRNGDTLDTLTPFIEWNPVENAVKYKVKVWDMAWNPVYNSHHDIGYFSDTHFTIPDGVLSPHQTYYFEVFAYDLYHDHNSLIRFYVRIGDASDCHKFDTDCDGCIDIEELMVAIAAWKAGEISMGELMALIGEWKYGCGSGPPCGQTQIATINVDGSSDDWAGIIPAIIDPSGDNFGGPPYDIKSVYTAMDENYAYVMVETYGEPFSQDAVIEINFDYKPGLHALHGAEMFIDLHTNITANNEIFAWNDEQLDGTMEPFPISEYSVARGNTLEFRIPLGQIENAEYFNATFINIHEPGPPRPEGNDPTDICIN